MTIMTKPGAIIKIQLLLGSQAKNYFESKERFFLETTLTKLKKDISKDLNLTNDEKSMLDKIFEKYRNYF